MIVIDNVVEITEKKAREGNPCKGENDHTVYKVRVVCSGCTCGGSCLMNYPTWSIWNGLCACQGSEGD